MLHHENGEDFNHIKDDKYGWSSTLTKVISLH